MSIFKKITKVYFSPEKKLFESVYNILGFYPNNISLYKLAFRHSSASNYLEKGIRDSNERLEFLGDSIIGMIISEYLFKKFPYKDEGFLTKIRSRMVSRAQHNKIALRLGLNNFIETNNQRFGMAKPNSINGDAYEALIGAIYLDKGYTVAQEFILKRVINIHIDMDEIETKELDFKSKVIEWGQKEKKEVKFEIASDGAIAENKQYEIKLFLGNELMGTAQHPSKKRAEQMVSEQACLILEI